MLASTRRRPVVIASSWQFIDSREPTQKERGREREGEREIKELTGLTRGKRGASLRVRRGTRIFSRTEKSTPIEKMIGGGGGGGGVIHCRR